jgi:hypothetical protein
MQKAHFVLPVCACCGRDLQKAKVKDGSAYGSTCFKKLFGARQAQQADTLVPVEWKNKTNSKTGNKYVVFTYSDKKFVAHVQWQAEDTLQMANTTAEVKWPMGLNYKSVLVEGVVYMPESWLK